MSIRFSISATSLEATDQDVVIDAHHIDTAGGWFEHPIRSHKLGIGHTLNLLAHVALGFVVHKGKRDELTLCFTHEDPGAAHGLELVEIKPPEAHPDVLPSVVTLDQVAADIDAVVVLRVVIPPGGNGSLSFTRGTELQIREVPMAEVADHG